MTTKFYHFLAPEGGHPTWGGGGHFIGKNQNERSFFLSLFNKVSIATHIFPSNKYDSFPLMFIIDQSRNNLQLKYSTELPPTLSQPLPFLQLQVSNGLKCLNFGQSLHLYTSKTYVHEQRFCTDSPRLSRRCSTVLISRGDRGKMIHGAK